MSHTVSLMFSVGFLSFVSFFSTVSPINCLIVYSHLSSHFTPEERSYVKNKSVLIATIITIVFMLIGPSGFKLIGIELFSVKIAGGIVLAVVAIRMVFGKTNNMKGVRQVDDYKKITVVPLALPIISSPPTIVTAIILFAQYNNWYLKLIVVGMLVFNFIIVYWLFSMSEWFERMFNKSVLNVLFILTGIILTALAVEFIVGGVKDSGVLAKVSYNKVVHK